MSASDFLKHVKSKGVPCVDVLLRYANFFQVMVQQHAACHAAHKIEERMCRWILLTQDRNGNNGFALSYLFRFDCPMRAIACFAWVTCHSAARM